MDAITAKGVACKKQIEEIIPLLWRQELWLLKQEFQKQCKQTSNVSEVKIDYPELKEVRKQGSHKSIDNPVVLTDTVEKKHTQSMKQTDKTNHYVPDPDNTGNSPKQ